MKLRTKLQWMGVVVGLFSLIPFQNCSQYSSNTFNDSSTVIKEASSDLSLVIKPISIAVDALEDKIVVGGDCEVGIYPNHYIEFQLYSQDGNPTLQPRTLIRLNPNPLCAGEACNKFTDAKCEQGKFYAHIPLPNNIPSDQWGIPYQLTGRLVLIENSGAEKKDLLQLQSAQVLVFGN